MKLLVAQSCLSLCNPIDYSSPGSSVHGILQARILEWVAKPSSRGSSGPRDQTHVSCTEADSLPSEPSDKPWGKRDAKISEKKGKKKFPGRWNIFRVISKYFSDCGDKFSLLFRKLPFFFCSTDCGILVPHSPGSGSMGS